MDIFVGSLPFKIKESELKEIFEKFGEVSSVTLIKDKRIGQNKGYGFVVMPDESKARQAIVSLNGTELMGRVIKVSESEAGDEVPEKPEKRVVKKGPFIKSKSAAKKKKIRIVTFGDPDKSKKKKGGIKLAKNFKVGKRRKK